MDRIPVGERFSHPSMPALGDTTPVKWIPVLFTGVQRLGRGVDHPPPLAPRLKSGTRRVFTPTGPGLDLHTLYVLCILFLLGTICIII